MKTILAVLALCAFAPGALAAAPECRAIENTMARLSCYDSTYPPKIVKPVVANCLQGPLHRGGRQDQRQVKEYLSRLLSDKDANSVSGARLSGRWPGLLA